MPAPFNYGIQTPDFQGQFLQGLQFLNAIEEQKKAKAQADNRKQVLTNFAALQNPTADDYAQVVSQLPEDQELFKKIYDAKDEGVKNAIFNGGADAYIRANAGDAEGAAKKLEEYAEGFANSGDDTHAQQFRDAAELVRKDPSSGQRTIGLVLAMADGERFKNLAPTSDTTTFQKDFQFIKDRFGPDAAAEYAQFGRDNMVSVPLGGGQTYVGPASMAPGASRWFQRSDGHPMGEQGGYGDGAITGAPPQATQPASMVDYMGGMEQRGFVTQAELDTIKQFFGKAGASAVDSWLKRTKIKVAVRTGTDADGRKVVQYADGTVGYAD